MSMMVILRLNTDRCCDVQVRVLVSPGRDEARAPGDPGTGVGPPGRGCQEARVGPAGVVDLPGGGVHQHGEDDQHQAQTRGQGRGHQHCLTPVNWTRTRYILYRISGTNSLSGILVTMITEEMRRPQIMSRRECIPRYSRQLQTRRVQDLGTITESPTRSALHDITYRPMTTVSSQ